MPNLIKTYQHIYAWGRVMGSLPFYCELQAEVAHSDGAPADVIHYSTLADLAGYGIDPASDPDQYFVTAAGRVWVRWRPEACAPALVTRMDRALRQVQISLGK